MFQFVGLDLSCARIRHTTGRVDDQEEFSAQPSSELATGITKPAWQAVEAYLQINNATHFPLNRNSLKTLLKNNFIAAQSPVRDVGQVNGVGLAIPYCTAAWIRQGLSEVSLGVERNAVWETPIAAAIAALLQQKAELSPENQCQIVISPSPWGMEVTRLRLSSVIGDKSQLELHVQMESIQEFFEEDFAVQLREAAATLREWVRERQLTLVGVETNDLVAQAAELVRTPATTTLPDASEAVSRLAAVDLRKRLLGSSFVKAKSQPILPRALGIVGQNSKGDLFWRRLFAAGESFQSGLETNLQFPSLPAGRAVLLADVRSPAPTWATIDQDETSVAARYYSLKDLPWPGSAWKLQVEWLAPQTNKRAGEGITLKTLPGGTAS